MRRVQLGLLVLLIAVAVSYLSLSVGPLRPGAESDVQYVEGRWAVSPDLASLSASTDATFIGRVVELLPQRISPPPTFSDSAAAAGKPANGGPSGFPITRIAVEVVESWRGDARPGDIVVIEQPGGVIGESTVVIDGDSPFEVGDEYLLFTSVSEDGSHASAPFARFAVEDGSITALAGWENSGAARELSGETIGIAKAEVAGVAR